MSKIEVRGESVELEHVDSCNLCGSTSYRTVFSAGDDRFPGDPNVYTVVECTKCGLGFLNPRPVPKSMGVYYPDDFFSSGESGQGAQLKFSREMSFVSKKSGRLLDIGCRNGGFPDFSNKVGFSADGLEIAANAENKFGVKIYDAFEKVSSEEYDVVTSWAVFEHLHDPKYYFSEVARVLKRGGEFVFLVPSFFSLRARLMMYEDIPRHLFFYTPNTLTSYLTDQGFVNIKVVPDEIVYYGGHRRILNWLAVKAIGREFGVQHRINPWDAYKNKQISLFELVYLLPFEHLDRLVHKPISKVLAKLGRHGSIVCSANKA